jgi:RimJ/RimL family protein N-acetyltransferase
MPNILLSQTKKRNRSRNKNRTSKSKPANKLANKPANKIDAQLQLISLANINSSDHINQLAKITSNPITMKHIGKGNIWSIDDIKQYITDEQVEQYKPHFKRQYYSFILLKNNVVIGFISGRKSVGFNTQPGIGKYDLLLRMFISVEYTGQGLGTKILLLFIEAYARMLHPVIGNKLRDVRLYSDIALDNTASLKIHQKNKFHFIRKISYNGKPYNRYVRNLSSLKI